MTFYGYILASALRFYLHFWGERRSYYMAAIFVGVSQMMCVVAALSVIRKFAGVDWVTPILSGGVFVLVMVGWLVGLSFYYTLERVELLQRKLAEKPEGQRIMWGIAAILSIVLPAAVFFLVNR